MIREIWNDIQAQDENERYMFKGTVTAALIILTCVAMSILYGAIK